MGEQLVPGQKRPLSFLDDGLHPLKKRRQASPRPHTLHHKLQSIPAAEPAILEQQALDKLLVDAIKTLCEEQGARRGIQDPVIESLALEAFRNATEECLRLKMYERVNYSMADFCLSRPPLLRDGPEIYAFRTTHSAHTS
jgi:hypothetical protein